MWQYIFVGYHKGNWRLKVLAKGTDFPRSPGTLQNILERPKITVVHCGLRSQSLVKHKEAIHGSKPPHYLVLGQAQTASMCNTIKVKTFKPSKGT